MADTRSLSVEEVGGDERELEDLDVDMWGMTVMMITKDFSDIMLALRQCEAPGGFRCYRLLYGGLCQALNIGMQLVLLFYVNMYVVRPAVHNIQEDYEVYHAEVFDPDGTFREDLWHAWAGPWRDLCNSVMTKFSFTSAIMLLWSTRMLGEFRSAWRLWRRVMRAPSMPAGVLASDMVRTVVVSGRDVSHIVFLNCGTRLMLLLFCVTPKAIVAVVLWFMGCRWLNATQHFDDLILNALALEFIVGIDEVILANFFPDRIHEDIDAMKFSFPKKVDGEAAEDAQFVRGFIRSFAFAALVFGWTFMYLIYWQQVLPGFERDIESHCQGDWFFDKFKVLCGEFDFTCFPYGPSDGKPLPQVPPKDGGATERLLHAPRGVGVTAASLLAEIALLPSVV